MSASLLISQLSLPELAPYPFGQVVGFHRAGPSTTLDKTICIFQYGFSANSTLQHRTGFVNAPEREETMKV